MKNAPYILGLLCILILGCKKLDTVPEPEEQAKQNVTFSVSHLQQSVEPFSKSGGTILAEADSIKKYAKYLYCRIFPQNSIYNYITLVQTADSAEFGTFNAKLTPGTYSVCFLASNQKLDLDQPVRRISEFRVGRAELNYWEDLFGLYNYRLVVEIQETSANIVLPRITGAIEVNLEDAIPENASKITLSVSGDADSYYFFYRVFDTTTSNKEFLLSDSEKGKMNRKFLMHILNVDGYPVLNLSIKGFDSQNNLLAERQVDIERIQMNKKTMLSGSLFKQPSPSGSLSMSGSSKSHASLEAIKF